MSVCRREVGVEPPPQSPSNTNSVSANIIEAELFVRYVGDRYMDDHLPTVRVHVTNRVRYRQHAGSTHTEAGQADEDGSRRCLDGGTRAFQVGHATTTRPRARNTATTGNMSLCCHTCLV